MTAFEVVPPALGSAAAAVRCFALDLHPVALRSSTLGDALADFTASWSSALTVLADDADAAARSLRHAAGEYERQDALLVPR